MNFKFFGKEVDIESSDWIAITARDRTTLRVGTNSIELNGTNIIINGNVVVKGSLTVSGDITATNVEEG
jgi:uncharacterized protein (DUF2345 family)